MTESKVVPFARSASFLHARAMKQKRAGNSLDALELLRRAAEAAPDGEGYWMDMAAVYADMRCFWDSRRMVLAQLFHRPELDECFYWLAKYDTEIGDMGEARRAFAQYLDSRPEGEMAEDARSEIEDIDAGEMLWRQVDRQSRRRVWRMKRARERQMEQNFETADWILAREQADLPKDDPHMCVSRALNLYMMGDEAAARAQMEQMPDDDRLYPGTAITAAQVYYRLQRPERAIQLLNGLDRQGLGESELRMMLYLLTDMNESGQAYQVGRELLRQTPYDRHLLHLMALNAVRQGMDDEVAAGFWQRIVRLDPDDEVARWYLNALREGRLTAEDVSDGYQLPKDEVVRRGERIVALMQQRPEQVKRAWREDEDARAAMRWCVTTEAPPLVEPGFSLLGSTGDREAHRLILEFLTRTRMGLKFDATAADILGEKSEIPRAGIWKYLKMKYLTPDYRALMRRLDVGHRQMIRMADDVLREEYGVRADVDLVLMWSGVREFTGNVPVVRDLRCGAAALALSLLRRRKADVTARGLARQFRCGARKLEYYAGWIAKAMDERKRYETLEFL